MNVQTACQAPSMMELRRPKCPRCGSILLVAEQSAFNLDGRIRHAWACDDCGNEFVTSIRLPPRQTM
jgi:DNA-directed RNA polymerase subunit RPC12/RpoP